MKRKTTSVLCVFLEIKKKRNARAHIILLLPLAVVIFRFIILCFVRLTRFEKCSALFNPTVRLYKTVACIHARDTRLVILL